MATAKKIKPEAPEQVVLTMSQHEADCLRAILGNHCNPGGGPLNRVFKAISSVTSYYNKDVYVNGVPRYTDEFITFNSLREVG